MATDLVELLSRLSLPTAPLPNYLDQTFTENAVRRAPQAVAFVPPPVVPIPQPATFFIGFGGAWEDACGFAASATVTGDDGSFCNCTTFTGAIFAAASTGTWYVSDGSQYVSVSITNGNPVATVTSACSACVTTTTTSTTTTTTTLDCAQTGSAFPTSSLDCVLTGSVVINVDPPPTTTTTTTTSTTTTTTTLCPIDCALTGSARASTLNNCSLSGSVYPTSICNRPDGLATFEFFFYYFPTSASVPDSPVVFTSSLSDACNACSFIQNNDDFGYGAYIGQSDSFEVGSYIYRGESNNCETLYDGFYITDFADCQITHVVSGSIVDINYCNAPPPPTTTSTTTSTTTEGTTTSTTTTTTTVPPTTTTTTSTTTSTTTAPPTTTSTTTSTTTPEPTTTTSTTTSTTTVTPTTTTSTTTSTTTAPVYSYGLGVDSISGANACTDYSISPVTYYSAAAALADGVVLYQDNALTTLAPDNYYSDGINNWLIVSGNGILTNQTSCPI